ncbi:MAG: hypothetical protein HQ582_32090 [Planctomycetes bacterium]|nr:hypothetical protein [Planctomycetota bacterium]
MKFPTIALVFSFVLTASLVFAANLTTHSTAALTAAKVAPEPFAGHWEAAFGGCHPDYMRDQPVGHENMRTSGLLFTREAVRYLRSGQINKALLLASARSHYIHDSACIAHADVWRPRKPNDVLVPGRHGAGVWSFLPARYQEYWLPIGQRKPGTHYDPIMIDKPPIPEDVWERLVESEATQSMHSIFDQIHNMTIYPDGFPLQGVPRAENWSAYDREFFARWMAECIALEVLDRESVLARTGSVKFVSAERFQQVRDMEMQNLVSATAAYYRYLTVAMKTDVEGDVERLLPSADRLALLARRDPRIYLSPNAPWALKRACHLLAVELVRASFRNRGLHGGQYAENLKEKCESLFETVAMPESEADRRVVIAWKIAPEDVAVAAARGFEGNHVAVARTRNDAGYAVLRGEDLQSAVHLVDYWLDLTNAPLNGRTPVDVMFEVFRLEWPGHAFLDELRTTPDDQLLPKFKRLENTHADAYDSWVEKVHWMVWPNSEGHGNLSGPLPPFWNLLLVDLPLPNGRKIDLTSQSLPRLDDAVNPGR